MKDLLEFACGLLLLPFECQSSSDESETGKFWLGFVIVVGGIATLAAVLWEKWYMS